MPDELARSPDELTSLPDGKVRLPDGPMTSDLVRWTIKVTTLNCNGTMLTPPYSTYRLNIAKGTTDPRVEFILPK